MVYKSYLEILVFIIISFLIIFTKRSWCYWVAPTVQAELRAQNPVSLTGGYTARHSHCTLATTS